MQWFSPFRRKTSLSTPVTMFGVAFADSPFGSFKEHDKTIFEVNDGGKDWMVPKYLYGATRADKAQTLSFNVAVPLKSDKLKTDK
jgi:hypothetical protein